MANDDPAALRVRRLLPQRPGAVVEKKMMGGLVFMLDGHMCCGINRGELMVRMGPEGCRQALGEPGVRPMTMGERTVRGFVKIEPAGFANDRDLRRWIQRAVDFVAALPARSQG
jgi:TfoX/Sxy family transcriptional regulator of competence genes